MMPSEQTAAQSKVCDPQSRRKSIGDLFEAYVRERVSGWTEISPLSQPYAGLEFQTLFDHIEAPVQVRDSEVAQGKRKLTNTRTREPRQAAMNTP